MLQIIQILQERFSDSMLSEFAWDKNSIGYESILIHIQNHENDFTDSDVELIRKVFKRDCEINGW
mgnify:CR=1 FL=1